VTLVLTPGIAGRAHPANTHQLKNYGNIKINPFNFDFD
jgi:hypothetical protein